jgi:uncharacterized protein YecE (DUF72 family)
MEDGDMNILVGTASWTDKSLIDCGRFYPKEATSAEARLRYYASRFPLVEVDSSYYAMPSPATAQLWAERTPADFTMNVKAFRLFTGHQTQPKVLHEDLRQALNWPEGRNLYWKHVPPALQAELWRRFQAALHPLAAAGRLGLVHFQFAPWVVCNKQGIAHVQDCAAHMPDQTLSVEFRHKSWFDEAHRADTLALLRELSLVHTVVDGPQGFSNSVPALWEATHPAVALLRLHGRNTESWNVAGPTTAASDRFNYDYSDQELGDIAAHLRKLARQVAAVHVVFNNNHEDQGQRNAATLMRLLHLAR